MNVSKPNENDLKDCAKIFKQNLERPPFNYQITSNESLNIIRNYFNTEIIYIASENNTIVGFIIGDKYLWVGGWRLWISELFVDLDNQGKGTSKLLLQTMENHFKKEGIKIMELMTHKDANAVNFYKKKNYNITNYVKLEKAI